MSNTTIPRKFDKVDGPYCEWIRTPDELDSRKTGVRACDTDLNVFNKETLSWYHIEEKTNSRMPKPDQILMMQLEQHVWQNADKIDIKKFLNYTMNYKSVDFEKVDFKYQGYWLLVYEKANLNCGSASLFSTEETGFIKRYDFKEGDYPKLLEWTMQALRMN